MIDNIEAIAKQCEDAGLVGAANTIRLLQDQQDVIRNILLGVYISCIKGVADAAIIKQQHFDIRHVVSAV